MINNNSNKEKLSYGGHNFFLKQNSFESINLITYNIGMSKPSLERQQFNRYSHILASTRFSWNRKYVSLQLFT